MTRTLWNDDIWTGRKEGKRLTAKALWESGVINRLKEEQGGRESISERVSHQTDCLGPSALSHSPTANASMLPDILDFTFLIITNLHKLEISAWPVSKPSQYTGMWVKKISVQNCRKYFKTCRKCQDNYVFLPPESSDIFFFFTLFLGASGKVHHFGPNRNT